MRLCKTFTFVENSFWNDACIVVVVVLNGSRSREIGTFALCRHEMNQIYKYKYGRLVHHCESKDLLVKQCKTVFRLYM